VSKKPVAISVCAEGYFWRMATSLSAVNAGQRSVLIAEERSSTREDARFVCRAEHLRAEDEVATLMKPNADAGTAPLRNGEYWVATQPTVARNDGLG
jgi:hypothetical protein